jgi:hypothetical protein
MSVGAAELAGVRIPDSSAAIEAEAVCRDASSPVLYAHALRSYFFAALLGKLDGVAYDEEMLYVGCVVHDVGLTERFAHPTRSFEMVSADVAGELTERHRWALTRRYTVHRAIVLHMSPRISQAELPEVLLLEAGVACDVAGVRIQDVSRRAVTEVLRRYSRADFARQFSATLQDEAQRKPRCAAAHLFELGLQRRIDQAPFAEQ